jgi:hypothetical protein
MSSTIDFFIQQNENTTSDKIVNKIKQGEWNDIIKGLCKIDDRCIFLDYIYFKHLASKETYPIILNYIINNIDNILLNQL